MRTEYKAATVAALVLPVFLALVWAVAAHVPVGVDFHVVFYPAARAVIERTSPYSVQGFYNPPWLLPLLSPLGLLPEKLAWGVFVTGGLVCYLTAFARAGMDRLEIVLAMFSPLVLYGLWYGNIDFLVLLGAMLPVKYGIWLVSLKPQMGAVLLLLWARRGEWRVVLLAGTGVLAVMLFRPPPIGDMFWNTSVWPWGIPTGVALAVLAFLRNDERLALGAGPFLSPYVAVPSWVTVLPPLQGRRKLLIVFLVLSWAAVLGRNLLYKAAVGELG
jgi:hypothetical protein